jgi:GxxExxY protein
MKHEALTSRIIGICIHVHQVLGPGLLEIIYEKAICIELDKLKIPYKRQQPVHAFYEEEDLGEGFRYDILVDGKVLLEIKSVENITPVFPKITLTYMKFTKIEVGLLINFRVKVLREGITRLVNDLPIV